MDVGTWMLVVEKGRRAGETKTSTVAKNGLSDFRFIVPLVCIRPTMLLWSAVHLVIIF